MKVMRVTIVYPRPGREEEVAGAMKQLGDSLAKQPGFIEDYSLAEHTGRRAAGRVSVWQSREALDRAASKEHTIALRTQLIGHPADEHLEFMFEVLGEHHR